MIRRASAALVAVALSWALLSGSPSEAIADVTGAPTTGAPADPIFEPADAQNLADLLADATAVQHVCYGWRVDVVDAAGPARQSTGSNFGPGRSLDSAGGSCPSRVEFTADITYTSDYSDANDSATWSVTSRPGGGPDTGDLDRLGLVTQGELIGDDPDVAVAALPQLAAATGIAPPVPATPASTAPPDVGTLTDDPGSDYLRQNGGLLGFGVVLLLGGLAFGVFALRSERARRDPLPPPVDLRPPSADLPPPSGPAAPPPPPSSDPPPPQH